MRKPLVAGNWKMNMDLAGARDLIQGVRAGLEQQAALAERVDVAACVPFVYLHAASEAAAGAAIKIGAQNCYYEAKGAFTGEISAAMLKDIGAEQVIIGHSERRHTIGAGEDDFMLNRKVRAALSGGLQPILCIGETLDEREAGQTLDVLTFQLTAGLVNAPLRTGDEVIIAYEPVWAIGTGKVATPDQAQEAHAHVRSELNRLYGDAANSVRILYGGSMKPDNAAELIALPDVDGGLIGGASLKADAFLGIIQAAAA